MNLVEKIGKEGCINIHISIPTQTGKSRHQTICAYIENFKHSNGVIFLVRNGGGRGDALAMAGTMQDINDRVVRYLRRLVKLPSVSVKIAESIKYNKFMLKTVLPKGNGTSTSLNGEEVSADEPFFTVMLGNLTTADVLLKKYLPRFTGHRLVMVDKKMRAKCALMTDESDLQSMTLDASNRTERSMNKKYKGSPTTSSTRTPTKRKKGRCVSTIPPRRSPRFAHNAVQPESRAVDNSTVPRALYNSNSRPAVDQQEQRQPHDDVDDSEIIQCLRDITVKMAFVVCYSTTATIFAMVCQACAMDSNNAKVIVVRPDISDYYTGYDDDLDNAKFKPERRVIREVLPATVDPGNRPVKQAFKVEGEDGKRVLDEAAFDTAVALFKSSKHPFKQIGQQIGVVASHMIADSGERYCLVRTDATIACANQATVASGLVKHLIAQAPQHLFTVMSWNNTGCDLHFATPDDQIKAAWAAAFTRAAQQQQLKTLTPTRDGASFSTTGGLRDILTANVSITKHTVCSHSQCNAAATMSDEYFPPTRCVEHSSAGMVVFKHLKWFYVSGLMASRAAVMKSKEHDCPLTDMYCDVSAEMHLEDVAQVCGRLNTITKDTITARLWASKSTHELHKKSILVNQALVETVEHNGSVNIRTELENASLQDGGAVNIAYINAQQLMHLTRLSMMSEVQRVRELRDTKALAADMSPHDIHQTALKNSILDNTTDDDDDDDDDSSDSDTCILEVNVFADAMEVLVLHLAESKEAEVITLKELVQFFDTFKGGTSCTTIASLLHVCYRQYYNTVPRAKYC
jgi:hypothetical protein